MQAKLLIYPLAAGFDSKLPLFPEVKGLSLEGWRKAVVGARAGRRARGGRNTAKKAGAKTVQGVTAGSGTRTITEYRPMIFGAMREHAVHRQVQRRTLLRTFERCLPFLYSALAVLLMVQTGATPWTAAFWMVFAPLVVAVEVAHWELSRSGTSNPPAAAEK